MFVSTHELEEELIINSIENIITNNQLKLCIAPRHPNRVNKILKILKKYNLSYKLESSNSDNIKDVTIIDSFGNLDYYFSKSEIVILGGSFVNKGGHNPLEPAKYNCALISGNLIYNWQNIYEEMVKEKACIVIEDINDLENKISELINNQNILKEFKNNALNFSGRKFFDSVRLFNEINLVLN